MAQLHEEAELGLAEQLGEQFRIPRLGGIGGEVEVEAKECFRDLNSLGPLGVS